MSAHIYAFADRSQWFEDNFPGDVMPHPNVIVLHTTEGGSWPGYSGGAVAPNFTLNPGVGIRQHFPANVSARALENRAGGVETNTLNVVQIELVGTCATGGPGLHWPSAGDEPLTELAHLIAWLVGEYPIPLVSVDKPWIAYPASYGNRQQQRMSGPEWLAFNGICGHQHVPENVHGDPGDFPIARLLDLVKGIQAGGGRGASAPAAKSPEPAPAPAPAPAPHEAPSAPAWDGHSYPGRDAFVIGKSHPAVTLLGQRLVSHGFGKHYTSGPGPRFSEADRANVEDYQHAQGWSGSDADGYPGPTTWERLAIPPKSAAPKSPRVSLSAVVEAARHDAPASGRPKSHEADTLAVERALWNEHLLASQYVDGSFGTTTVSAYAAWQRRCGYSGADANGIPGHDSLARLGAKHGFEVTT